MKVLIVNRFFGGAQIPTGRMAEDVARRLVEEGHEVVALASSGEYAGAVAQALDQEDKRPKDEKAAEQRLEIGSPKSANGKATLHVETVRVPKWMPRALAWVWFTWQARKRIPKMDWDVCVLMTDPPLLPLLAAKAACGKWRVTSNESTETEHQPGARSESANRRWPQGKQREAQPRATTASPPRRAKRRIAVWLMDLYPEALAASGRIAENNPLYRWYFNKRQRALAASDLLICLGQSQKQLVETVSTQQTACGLRPTQIAVVPPWDDRGNIDLATEDSLKNLALYAGNLGEAHCFGEILAAAPHLPADWTIRFAARGAKLDALRAKARNLSHGFTRIATDRVRTAALTGRGEKLVPDDLGTRKSSSDEKAANLKGHSRPQGDRQLEELSEAVKLTRMKGRISPPGSADRTAEKAHAGGPPALAVSPPSEEAKNPGAKVEITGYASEKETPGLLASARVHLITMSPGWEGVVVPSKLYGCVRTGRPVVFIGPENADTAREIRAHDWGKVLPPGASGEEVAAAILELAARPTRALRSESGAKKVAELIQGLATAEKRETA